MASADTSAPSVPVVVIGASAGGMEPLLTIFRSLPADFPAAVLVVMHLAPRGPSVLPSILGRVGTLAIAPALDGTQLEAGTAYVAGPDEHLTIDGTTLRPTQGPRVHGYRPAIDLTLASVAESCGASAVAVILSGTLEDGSRGAAGLKAAGGLVFVQDPEEARHAGMIAHTQSLTDVDAVLPAADLGPALIAAVQRRLPVAPPSAARKVGTNGATRYTCPVCGSVLERNVEAGDTRYVCSVGHAYTPATLGTEQAKTLEAALEAAVRILGDREELLTEMAELADQDERPLGAIRFRDGARQAEAAVTAIRSVVETAGWDMHEDLTDL